MTTKERKTKYSLGEIVWFIKNDKIRKGIVTRIYLTDEYMISLGQFPRQLQAINTELKEVKTCIYNVHYVMNGDEVSLLDSEMSEDKMFATKEELLKYLSEL